MTKILCTLARGPLDVEALGFSLPSLWGKSGTGTFMCMFCRSLFVLLSFFLLAIAVCPSSIYGFWLPLWYLQTFNHYIFCPSSIYGFWLPLWYLQTFNHYIVCPSSIYGFWLPLWYLQTFLRIKWHQKLHQNKTIMQCLFFSDTVMIKRYYTEILSKNYCLYMSNSNYIILFERGRRCRDRLVVGFTTTCAISAYYH